jgi:hypothetical protein
MASGAFLDPLKLLRLAPLISTTGSLVHASCELVFLTCFLHPSHRTQSNAILPSWFKIFFYRAVWSVVAFNFISVSTCTANLFIQPDQLPVLGKRFYTAGLVAAIGHMLFIPAVKGPIQRVLEDRGKGNASGELESWLIVHKIRMVVADLPAWLSCLAAVVATISV